MAWVDEKIERIKEHINETPAFRLAFEKAFIDIIEETVRRGKSVSDEKKSIVNHFKSAGLDRYLVLFGDDFFGSDFREAYQKDKRSGIKSIINSYWNPKH